MTSINCPVRLAVLSLTAVLALTACSSSTHAFDFTEASAEPSTSIEFQIPSELVESSETYAGGRVFESVTVSAAEIEDSAGCGVNYQIEYAEGGYELLEEYFAHEEGQGKSRDETMSFHFFNVNKDAMDANEDFTSVVLPVKCASSPVDSENTRAVKFMRIADSEGVINSSEFARAEVSVMVGGELSIQEFEVDGWQADSNGAWIKE
ncbi:hypothetical protein [Nocardiopsis sp. NPDC006938]|uniref:hypothetical protein n=1 Tax=Nocardiopsis sp. NPDC006938 TaxID=3364337 RepID=UPI0036C00731